jgi:HSP20 family protein
MLRVCTLDLTHAGNQLLGLERSECRADQRHRALGTRMFGPVPCVARPLPASSNKQGNHMTLFPDPFNPLLRLQEALDSYRTSGWLQSSPSGSGSYPPLNIFRKGDDLVLIAEVPGISKSAIDLQVKGRTIRLSGTKAVAYGEKASLHRRERLAGRFDRSVTLPVEVDPDGVKAECQDGILALFLPQAERDKPRSIKIG